MTRLVLIAKDAKCEHPTGCLRPYYALGLCELHYRRQRLGRACADAPAPEMLRDDLCAFVGPHGRCVRPVHCRGLCKPHYEQQRRGQELRTLKDALPKICQYCDDPVEIKSQQMCSKHYQQFCRGTLFREDRSCINCDTIFTPKRSDHLACCDKCSYENARLKYTYGITGSELNAMVASQDGKCWTCKRPIARGDGNCHVDHDHACCPSTRSCGKCLRKVLCFNCNAALGQIGDSVEVAYALGDYLTYYHAERVERLGELVETLGNAAGP